MTIKPQNFEEKLVWYYLVGTYGWYLLGAQYILVPALAWVLCLYLCKKLWNQTENTPDEEKIIIPFSVWVWIVCMTIIEIAIVMGHINFNLSPIRLIQSTINWGRHQALLALFPLIGCLNIRPQLVYRAICIIALHSLVFIAVGYAAVMLKLPGFLYASPLAKAGGTPVLYFVQLYFTNQDDYPRMSLFAPWGPALGLLANVYFLLACQESNRRWRWIGIIGSVAMIVVSVSRAAMVCLPVNLILTLLWGNFTQPIVQITVGSVSFLMSIFVPQLINLLKTFQENFDNTRPASSRIRRDLDEIGIYRWWNEARIWGHGIQEYPGPKLVEHMAIGSHHTWIGLLFTNGIVGFIALAVPFLWSFVDLLIKAQNSKLSKVGLSIVLTLFIFTFVENIEVMSYLYWPGLLLMGIAFKEVVYVKNSVVALE